MRGRSAFAIAMRAPDGSIKVHTEPLGSLYRSRVASIPFLRGVLLLWDALGLGMRALTISANTQTGEGQKLEGPALYLTLAASLSLGVGLFFVIPALLGGIVEHALLPPSLSAGSGTLAVEGLAAAGASLLPWAGNLIEGGTRLLFLIGYIWAIGFMPEIKRLFGYHGAEHKTINAFEAGAELTPASVAAFPVEHARCGTAFLLTLVLISIVLFTAMGPMSMLWRIISRVLLIPVLAGIALEYIRWTARNLDKPMVRWLIIPNLALQRLTTRVPDDEMLEVAIQAFQSMRAAETARAG